MILSSSWTTKPQSCLKWSNIYSTEEKLVYTPETFDITDTSLATLPPSPTPAFLVVQRSAISNCCWATSQGLSPPPSQGLSEVGVGLLSPWMANISSSPPPPPPSSPPAGWCWWWRSWAPSPAPPPRTQSCLLTDPEDGIFGQI